MNDANSNLALAVTLVANRLSLLAGRKEAKRIREELMEMAVELVSTAHGQTHPLVRELVKTRERFAAAHANGSDKQLEAF